MWHRWIGCEDECSSCLTCGAQYSDEAIDAGEVSPCSGRTDQFHTHSPDECAHVCDGCAEFDESGWVDCEHIAKGCNCDLCMG